MKVTYVGPTHRSDGTTEVVAGDFTFLKGVEVDGVPKKVAEQVRNLNGLRFEINDEKKE